ncbi:hypothetical protein [Burkholderia cepacia]|uniref:hypothetical protein n=1 Tax=Burkholderia cepacia TaxID=292 RepID=UPI002AB63F32|nr:hypothetical protein [Burkholderia cepacia]
MNELDEIKVAKRFCKDGSEWAIRCEHCREVIYVEDGDDGTPRGEQYRHRACGGWNEVSVDATLVKDL